MHKALVQPLLPEGNKTQEHETYPNVPTQIYCDAVHLCAHMHTQHQSNTWPMLSPSRMWLCLHHSVLNIRELLATICIFLFLSFPSVSPFSVPSLLLYKARPQGGFSLTRGPSSQTCTSPEPPNQPKVLEEEEVPQLWPRSPSWDLNSQGHHSEFAQHLTVSCSA